MEVRLRFCESYAMPTLDLIPTAEVAEIVGVGVATVNRWAENGTLPTAARAPGPRGARLFARPDVLRIAEERRAKVADQLAQLDAAAGRPA